MAVLKRGNAISVKDINEGLKFAKNFLYNTVDKNTVLFLSGGGTPKPLYQDLAKEKKLEVGAVGMVDERLVPPFDLNTNEKMIKDTGLMDYFVSKKIPFYSILRLHPRGAKQYDKTVRCLFAKFEKHIAIMGIGEDGHIAGLPAKSQISNLKSQNYVIGISDFPGEFKKRITLTFKALSEMDLLIVLVFGFAKKNVLNLMFAKGSEEEIPARFFKRPDIAKKTIVITDQKA